MKKNKNIYINKKIKGAGKAFLAGALAVSVAATNICAPVYAAAEKQSGKQEVVYANLEAGGAVTEVYVVNIFSVSGNEVIEDYGDYSQVRNMTTTDEIRYENGKVTISPSKEKLYYEGTLESAELPWDIDIRYFLDDKEYEPKDLAGKDGALRIEMSVKENTSCDGDFYDYYALQISLTLDTDRCNNIEADGATQANVGKDKQLTYTVLPGKGTDLVIYADVTDFEMDGISINGVQLNMNIDVDTQSGEISDQITELQDAVDELDSGAKELKDGSDDLREGSKELYDGAGELVSGSNSLMSGAGSLTAGANSLVSGAEEVKNGAKEVADGANSLSGGLSELSGQSAALTAGAETVFNSLIAQTESGIADVRTLLGNFGVSFDALTISNYGTVLQGMSDTIGAYQAQIDGALAMQGSSLNASAIMSQLASAKASLDSYAAFYQGLQAYTAGVNEAGAGAATLAAGAQNLADGTSQLYDGAAALNQGAGAVSGGIKSLSDGSRQLYDGTEELKDGAEKLADGTGELADGTGEFAQQTGDLDTKLEEKVDETVSDLFGSDYEPVSFVSERNKNIQSVQFVIKTEGVTVPETEAAAETEKEELGFFDRLLNLFK